MCYINQHSDHVNHPFNVHLLALCVAPKCCLSSHRMWRRQWLRLAPIGSCAHWRRSGLGSGSVHIVLQCAPLYVLLLLLNKVLRSVAWVSIIYCPMISTTPLPYYSTSVADICIHISSCLFSESVTVWIKDGGMTMACLSGIGHGKQIYRELAAVLPD